MNEKQDPIYEATSMDGLSGEKQALQAIKHILGRIREDSYTGYYLGLGTESFALLTEAFATLSGNPVRATRLYFTPKHPVDPANPAPYEPAPTLELYERIEWDARDHADFFFPILELQDALAPAGIHIGRIHTGIPGHYEIVIES